MRIEETEFSASAPCAVIHGSSSSMLSTCTLLAPSAVWEGRCMRQARITSGKKTLEARVVPAMTFLIVARGCGLCACTTCCALCPGGAVCAHAQRAAHRALGVRSVRMRNVLHIVPSEEVHFSLYWTAVESMPFPQVCVVCRVRLCESASASSNFHYARFVP
eukprot:scaffold11829_cov20-Tisochrysis_lutea.AAC.1